MSPSTFTGLSVLVTGGGRGIGRASVAGFAAGGATVTFADLHEASAAETVAASGGPATVRFVKADITDGAQAKAAVEAAVEHGGGQLDVLVNNAGITKDNLLLRMTDEEWDRVMAVNLKGVFLVTRAAARPLMKSKQGRIVNVASVVGIMGNAGQANYAASKGGVISFTKSIARELSGRGVTANAVAPGYISTDMTANLPAGAAEQLKSRIPLGRLGAVEDVAGVVLFLASPAAGYVTGQVICVDGGMVM